MRVKRLVATARSGARGVVYSEVVAPTVGSVGRRKAHAGTRSMMRPIWITSGSSDTGP